MYEYLVHIQIFYLKIDANSQFRCEPFRGRENSEFRSVEQIVANSRNAVPYHSADD
jgi:hypothetical protein